MKLATLLVALIVATTSAQACDHAIVLSNWKSCSIGQLSEDGGDADWAAVPAWTKSRATRQYFFDDPRLLALHGLCNEKFHRVIMCLFGWEDRVMDKDKCWYQICLGKQVERIQEYNETHSDKIKLLPWVGNN